jgi:hypothetical protein
LTPSAWSSSCPTWQSVGHVNFLARRDLRARPQHPLDDHVTLKYESVDRIFLNGYVARLQEPDQLAWFLGQHRGQDLPRYELLGKITSEFVAAIEKLAEDRHIPLVHFEKGQRKETIAEPYFAHAALLQREGVVLIGIAQEKAKVFRPPPNGRRGRGGGFAAGHNSAFVKHVYFYIWDADFGPTFIKFCTYAPWSWPERRRR